MAKTNFVPAAKSNTEWKGDMVMRSLISSDKLSERNAKLFPIKFRRYSKLSEIHQRVLLRTEVRSREPITINLLGLKYDKG